MCFLSEPGIPGRSGRERAGNTRKYRLPAALRRVDQPCRDNPAAEVVNALLYLTLIAFEPLFQPLKLRRIGLQPDTKTPILAPQPHSLIFDYSSTSCLNPGLFHQSVVNNVVLRSTRLLFGEPRPCRGPSLHARFVWIVKWTKNIAWRRDNPHPKYALADCSRKIHGVGWPSEHRHLLPVNQDFGNAALPVLYCKHVSAP